MNEKQISEVIIGCAFELHKTLGPGLPDSVYRECLFRELVTIGMMVRKEQPLMPADQDASAQNSNRMGLVVEDKVVVELKSADAINDADMEQALAYLRLSDCKLGLLFNFNVPHLKEGIRRLN